MSDSASPGSPDAFDRWREAVLANREQIERLREDVRQEDFYAGRSTQFRPAPEPSPETEYLRSLLDPTDILVDIGAGGGRLAVPLSRSVARVHAFEPSEAMRTTLRDAAAAAAATNIEIHASTWPPPSIAEQPVASVALAANVLYDIDDPRSFLAAMERSALCCVILGDRAPSNAFEPLWSELWGEPHRPLPAIAEFMGLLTELDRVFEIRTFARVRPEPLTLDEALTRARRTFWLAEGSAREQRLAELLAEHYGRGSEIVMPARINYMAAVTWRPRRVGAG